MRPFATWKYVALVLMIVFGVVYSAPNFYGEDPSVQITLESGDAPPESLGPQIAEVLKASGLTARSSGIENAHWVVRFDSPEAQLKGNDEIKKALGDGYLIALNLASKTPRWLAAIGAKPMSLGLDLRGGVHFLLEVDVDEVRKTTVQSLITDLPALLREKNIRYTGRHQTGDALVLDFADADKFEAARKLIAKEHPELTLAPLADAPLSLEAKLSEKAMQEIAGEAVKANLTTLKNRVNQLGVAEPVVQRQGATRIVVQLPGVQDTTRVKELLGATATLEYRAVAEGEDANAAAASGYVPSGTELFYTRNGHIPALLKKEVIVSGHEITSASPMVDQQSGTPAVSVKLNGGGAKRMRAFTEKSVGRPMAVLLREREVVTTYNAKGQPIREQRQKDEIISIANIREAFGPQFQTTGLESKEAHDLALLLKAGALAAPVEIVEERTVGPSLGADNIRRGFQAAALGLGLVATFMVFYYRVFGLFAIAALVLNLFLLVAPLSLLQATLSMPGIAGIVLTMGIAVDANVLIYERIREELRGGKSPLQAIEAGYDRAFLTIADANVTTLIAAIALGVVAGAGPVRGFAITLGLGIIASQFTAIVGSRALAQLAFGRKARLKDLPIW